MTLRNFDDTEAPATETAPVGLRQIEDQPTADVVTEHVTVRQRESSSRSHLTTTDWGWEELRDYVVTSIEKRWGVFPRDSRKEAGIFKSFLARWPSQAQQIARYAFEVSDGRWRGAPVSVNRFCKASDPYFAAVIAERLVEGEVTGW